VFFKQQIGRCSVFFQQGVIFVCSQNITSTMKRSIPCGRAEEHPTSCGYTRMIRRDEEQQEGTSFEIHGDKKTQISKPCENSGRKDKKKRVHSLSLNYFVGHDQEGQLCL
jgi:hypothetical protein